MKEFELMFFVNSNLKLMDFVDTASRRHTEIYFYDLAKMSYDLKNYKQDASKLDGEWTDLAYYDGTSELFAGHTVNKEHW